MDKIIVLGKLKFDLRDPDEAIFAQHELSAILNVEVEPIKTIPALFKSPPFSELDEIVIRIITRHLYLGEVQGYLARVENVNTEDLIYRPAFFREIYIIIGASDDKAHFKNLQLPKNKNLYQVFTSLSHKGSTAVIRLFPLQTLFEYVTDVKKLPDVAITPRNTKNWMEYFNAKEKGIDEGLDKLLDHIKNNHFRPPHLGLGKRHIGDFVDWASTDLRKPFLHYIHKYKGKGDPRISRALINLLKVKKGDTILDPFAGSGAFIADAPTMGLNAVGVEILEIGKLIAEVKSDLNYDITKLRSEILKLFSSLERSDRDLFIPKARKTDEEIKRIRLKLERYLGGGRHLKNILPHLSHIVRAKDIIDEIRDEKIRKFLLILLSQKIVEFSEKRRAGGFIPSFRSYTEDRYLTLYATIKLAEKLGVNLNGGKVRIFKADSTNMDFLRDNSIDGILTSPPYFDALDYVGNNKVSIVILGFEDDLRLGSTKEYYAKFGRYNLALPESSLALINLLKESKRSSKAEIVENYLKMMKLSFRECYRVLKPGGFYAMVVSKYHSWVINGKERRVETSKVLADIGISEGFKLAGVIQHGLSKADKGKINVEDILLFQK